MKSVLISIKPKYCELIVNGEKTIEVRKTRPKIDTPFKCYIYMSQGDLKDLGLYSEWIYKNRMKVVGEFICDKVDEYTFSHYCAEYRVNHVEQKSMCLNHPDLIHYGKGETIYGWRISDFKIYDKPKELSDFCIPCKTNCEDCKKPLFYDCWKEKGKIKVVTRPPQSYMYVEEI